MATKQNIEGTPVNKHSFLPLNEENELDDELPFLSVLNIVIDHCMMDPTPMEPQEWKLNQRVPILRVFGPAIRDGSTLSPEQSCCLFIHGAFPYMLARPMAAGPDGSSSALTTSPGYVDWDCPNAVASIVSNIQESLESSIQQSLETPTVGDDKLGNTNHTKKIIRSISVVQGRGFYTFCPGPAAPFLRVEYYDPKLRWKVKMMLERGLDLPARFYPDPQQYDRCQDDIVVRDSEPLVFHCYEAHIPYTMQFFKDWNLAGMAYIHLSKGGKFRSPLPLSARQQSSTSDLQTSDHLFLHGNTDPGDLWINFHLNENESLVGDSQMRQPVSESASILELKTATSLSLEKIWSKKETSCDIEFDCFVDQIMNTRTVITSKQKNDSVHWRAVPSLREIWRQERRRMSLLLPRIASNSLTIKNDSPDFTLDVKKNAPTPGTKLAVLGMRQLLRLSDGLEQEFDRAMRQIIDRYSQEVRLVDKMMSTAKQLNPLLENIGSTQGSSTINDADALEALEALGGQFNSSQVCQSLGTESTVMSQLQQDKYEENALIFSQRVDRGENVEENNRYEFIDDYIDPHTLTPYEFEDEDDEDCLDEDEFEQKLTLLAQNVDCEGNKQSISPPEVQEVKSPMSGTHLGHFSNQDKIHLLENHTKFELNNSAHLTATSEQSLISSSRVLSLEDLPQREKYMYAHYRPAPSRLMLETKKVSEDLPYHLHPIEKDLDIPCWLVHCSRFKAVRESLLTRNLVRNTWQPSLDKGTFFVTPVLKPPTRRHVSTWLKKLTKEGESADSFKRPYPDVKIERPLENMKNKRHRVSIKDEIVGIGEIEQVKSFRNSSDLQAIENLSNSCKAEETANYCDQGESLELECTNSPITCSTSNCESQETENPLEGVRQQGGRIYIEGGGGLKTKTKSSPTLPTKSTQTKSGILSLDLQNPLTMMSIEIHVQCRSGRAGINDGREIALQANFEKDKISAVIYTFAKDPGGGETLKILEQGVIFVPVEADLKGDSFDKNTAALLARRINASTPRNIMGVDTNLRVEIARDEKQLMLRLSSIVRWKDPDMLLSWDPQGSGLGYILERGAIVGKSSDHSNALQHKTDSSEIDMARLLGRIPMSRQAKKTNNLASIGEKLDGVDHKEDCTTRKEIDITCCQWSGSGLGIEWDERVGPGVAAASIVSEVNLLWQFMNW
jgi:hypothetical protein